MTRILIQDSFAPVILCLLLVFFPTISSAEITAVAMEPLHIGLDYPYDVAASEDGRIAVSDPSKDKILVYNQTGALIQALLIAAPTTLAFSRDGHLYIASLADRAVRILDRSYRHIGWLGSGPNEFRQPRNITIDRLTGDVYVIDQTTQKILAYSSSGDHILTLDDSPNLPQDCVIIGSELFVLDQPLVQTREDGEPVRGGRVKVYDLNDPSRTRAFGKYGTGEGEFVGPRSIAADRSGYLYIADSFHSVVFCFDQDGNYITAVQNYADPINTPVAVTLDTANRMYVASTFTSDIKTFTITGSPADFLHPSADIRVNETDGPLAVCQPEALSLTITFDPGDWLNETGDLLVAYQGPAGFVWYVGGRWHQSEKPQIMRSDVLHSLLQEETMAIPALAPGSYTFFMGVDTSMNDDPSMRDVFMDQVVVKIKSAANCP